MHQLFKQNNYFSHRSATRNQKFKWSSVQLRIVNFAVSETFWDAAMFFLKPSTFRSSHPRCSLKKVFWKYVANLQENTHAKQLYWNHTSAWVFFCKFAAYFLNTLFSKSTSGRLLLDFIVHEYSKKSLKGKRVN